LIEIKTDVYQVKVSQQIPESFAPFLDGPIRRRFNLFI
jgi:hypothetical protein